MEASVRYPEFTWDAPWLNAVDRVFLPSGPSAFPARHADEVMALSGKPVTCMDGEMVSWHSSRVIIGLRYLANLLANLRRFFLEREGSSM